MCRLASPLSSGSCAEIFCEIKSQKKIEQVASTSLISIIALTLDSNYFLALLKITKIENFEAYNNAEYLQESLHLYKPQSIMIKKTALYNKHLEFGAKMVEFAGYMMPLKYGSEIEEHLNIRKNVGVFDVSHMGEFLISGPRALDLIQWVTSNDASKLQPGKAQYSCLPNERGGIVDDLLVYQLKDEEYMLVVNAANIEKDWLWISEHNEVGANMENISDDVSMLAVQGPNAEKVLQKLTNLNLSEMKFYTFSNGNIGKLTQGAIISATGYTGAGGFEVYMYNEYAEQIWDAIFEAGAEFEIKPAGLGARDTLRLEMGYCLYGNDLDDSTSPIEAGLGWITKFSKDFINSDQLKMQKENGVDQRLVGFEMKEKGIPRKDYEIVDDNGDQIGRVTSGTMSPSLGKGIGMGYVKTSASSQGNDIFVAVRNRNIPAVVIKPPFI
jgi:aminomethyltransferase